MVCCASKPQWVENTRLEWNNFSKGKSWIPDIQSVTNTLTLILVGLSLWGILYFLFKEDVAPGSQIFSLIAMVILAYIAGRFVTLLKLPALLGMLLTGILLRNVGFIHLTGHYVELASFLREAALACILIRAGLGLDFVALKKLSMMVVRLSVVPCVVEAVATCVLSHYLLGLSWLYGILLGFLLGAVSPAVVIPCLFALQEKGYGTDKGIPTLVIAAASFDDVIAISAFGVVLSIIFSTGSITMQVLSGPIGVVIGVVFGILWGLIGWVLPHKHDKFIVLNRCLLVAVGGLFAILGSEFIEFPGAGPLACIIAPFVACMGWKKEGWTYDKNPVRLNFGVLWTFFEPGLFSLIGSEVDLSVLEGKVVGYAIAVLLVVLAIRILVTAAIAYGGGFSWKERIFIAWAWFPKATVQAALGPIALDLARENNSEEDIKYASIVLITAVLAILLTAPAGAILITLLGPICLPKAEPKQVAQPENKQLNESENKQTEEDSKPTSDAMV